MYVSLAFLLPRNADLRYVPRYVVLYKAPVFPFSIYPGYMRIPSFFVPELNCDGYFIKMISALSQIFRVLTILYVLPPIVVYSRNFGSSAALTADAIRNGKYTSAVTATFLPVRGGDDASVDARNEVSIQESDTTTHDDSERYSRQMYVLGARAHALVRSSNIIVDGPLRSGLLYECVKNLALSGVGSIILLSDNTNDANDEMSNLHRIYHNEKHDDLGNAYTRAAQEETGSDEPSHEVILQYLQRLNPSLSVSIRNRSQFAAKCSTSSNSEKQLGVNPATTVYLCIDRPESTQLTASAYCRKLQIPLVSTETVGVYGRIFCDFGPDFVVLDPDGETPRQTLLDRVEVISNNVNTSTNVDALDLTVFCVEEAKHDVSRGDSIQFHWNQAYEEQDGESGNRHSKLVGKVLHVKSPSQFTIRIQLDEEEQTNNQFISQDIVQKINDSAHYFSKMKQPISVPFLPMQDALDAAKKAGSGGKDHQNRQLFTICDLEKSSDIIRRNALMACFHALEQFVRDHSRLPSSQTSQLHLDEFFLLDLVKKSEFYSSIFSGEWNNIREQQQEAFEKIAKSFARCSDGKLVPVQALMGAIAAQEALKAVSRLYRPIQQFLLYDCDELLQEHGDSQQEPPQKQEANTEKSDINNDASSTDIFDNVAPGQTAVLGHQLSLALTKAKIFVVGSGAIGCELLKNLAAIGAATNKEKGKIVVTDMDTIEKSNLSRQLLFRDNDVGTFKSIAAEQAVKRFNPHVQIEVHTSKVSNYVG